MRVVNNTATNVRTTPLRYTNFIAEVGPIARPDVFNFVRRTKPLGMDGTDYDVREISGYYGKFQKGITHTNASGFNARNSDEEKMWTFIEFDVVVKGKKKVIARLYQNKMILQGGFVDNDMETPLKVATYIVKTYLRQNSAGLALNFLSIDGVFQVSGVIPLDKLSEALRSNGTKHVMTNPELRGVSIRDVQYEGEVIDVITRAGFITLKRKTFPELQQAYKLALKFVERMDARGLIKHTPDFAPAKETTAPSRVALPRVTRVRNANVFLNNALCSKYSIGHLKQICKQMGIVVKKDWKKLDMCNAIFEKSVKKNVVNYAPGARGINDAFIRASIQRSYGARFKRGRNVNEDLRIVKNRMKSVKTNKKGLPFKMGVDKLVKEVTQERKLNTYLQNYQANLRPIIRRRITTISKTAVDTEANKLKHLTKNQLNLVKNIRKNVNLKTYLRQRQLALNYITSVVRPGRRNSVRRETTAWLNALNKSPNNDSVKRRLLRIIRTYDDPLMNMQQMERLHARRTKRS